MNTKIRRADRAITDVKEIEKIVSKAKILHLGLIDEGYPYIIPLHYGYEYDKERNIYIFYMHSAKTGHKLNLISKNPNVCIELETDVKLISGGEVPCEYSSFYSSYVGKGTGFIVESNDEKSHALKLLMKNQTNKEFIFTEQMLSSITVIKVKIYQYTAKAKNNL